MRTRWSFTVLCLLGLCVPSLISSLAQDIQFTLLERLTNNEVALTLNAPTGINYRIDEATNLPDWNGMVTLPISTATSLQHTDSAAPYLNTRFYRAAQLTGTNSLVGDHIPTTNGDVVVRPIGHASFVMSWNGKMIYNDPTNGATPYVGLPRADLVLVSHGHSDHFNGGTIDAVRGTNCVIITPLSLSNSLSAAQRTNAIFLGYGASTNVIGLNVEAVHAYNGNHPQPTANGYVLTIGGKRIYLSGDTGNQAEIRALTNIDVAFICMNPTFTMSVNDATNLVHAMRPKVVYPYHYRESGTVTNGVTFKQRLSADLGIEVRLRRWY